jgi:hypothetical protein
MWRDDQISNNDNGWKSRETAPYGVSQTQFNDQCIDETDLYLNSSIHRALSSIDTEYRMPATYISQPSNFSMPAKVRSTQVLLTASKVRPRHFAFCNPSHISLPSPQSRNSVPAASAAMRGACLSILQEKFVDTHRVARLECWHCPN